MASSVKTQLMQDARALQAAVAELVRIYQVRDRDRICCHDISVTQCHALEVLVARGPMRAQAMAERAVLREGKPEQAHFERRIGEFLTAASMTVAQDAAPAGDTDTILPSRTTTSDGAPSTAFSLSNTRALRISVVPDSGCARRCCNATSASRSAVFWRASSAFALPCQPSSINCRKPG